MKTGSHTHMIRGLGVRQGLLAANAQRVEARPFIAAKTREELLAESETPAQQRRREIRFLGNRGYTTKMIARQLGCSLNTAAKYFTANDIEPRRPAFWTNEMESDWWRSRGLQST